MTGSTENNKPNYVIVWDFDGPVNSGQLIPKTGRMYNQINCTNKEFLQLTFDILSNNNIQSVIGSQRITYYKDDNPDIKQSYRQILCTTSNFH